METDLSLASLDEIIAELKRRAVGIVVALHMPPENGSNLDGAVRYSWSGKPVAARSLANLLSWMTDNEVRRERGEPLDPNYLGSAQGGAPSQAN